MQLDTFAMPPPWNFNIPTILGILEIPTDVPWDWKAPSWSVNFALGKVWWQSIFKPSFLLSFDIAADSSVARTGTPLCWYEAQSNSGSVSPTIHFEAKQLSQPIPASYFLPLHPASRKQLFHLLRCFYSFFSPAGRARNYLFAASRNTMEFKSVKTFKHGFVCSPEYFHSFDQERTFITFSFWGPPVPYISSCFLWEENLTLKT